jgi:tRNA pseudouridine38-40 synthase
MKRYFFEIVFNGKNYHGWQIQQNAITVQQLIDQSIKILIPNLLEINIVGCGRTDKGVHAEQFFFHVDLPIISDVNKFKFKLNRILPSDISIENCFVVSNEFHARYSAVSRTYEYRIIQNKSPFLEDYSSLITQDLDLELMNTCASMLKNHQDFTSFSKVQTVVNNFNCHIMDAKWYKLEKQLVFSIKANRFLRNMVRAIVGTILMAGKKNITLEQFAEIIEAKNRSAAGPSASAKGLFLTKVEYPEL